MYIQGIGALSPLSSLNVPGLPGLRDGGLRVLEPNYASIVDPIQLRRMNRITKMGIAAGKLACSEAGLERPEAIVMGTGMGCLEYTEQLLTAKVRSEKQNLNPSCFINSTHNTISAQLAIQFGCRGYNSTYSQRELSFESALTDARMLLEEGSARNVMAGGADELSPQFYRIKKKIGCWKKNIAGARTLVSSATRGSIPGEGVTLFCLSKEKVSARCKLEKVAMLFRPATAPAIDRWIRQEMAKTEVSMDEIDLILYGINGDVKNDALYYELRRRSFPAIVAGYFKHLCGQYATATAFALALSCRIVQDQRIAPQIIFDGKEHGGCRNILIYNQFASLYHSLLLVSAC